MTGHEHTWLEDVWNIKQKYTSPSWYWGMEEIHNGTGLSWQYCMVLVEVFTLLSSSWFSSSSSSSFKQKKTLNPWDLMETMCRGSYSFQSVFAPWILLSPHTTAWVYWRLARNPNTQACACTPHVNTDKRLRGDLLREDGLLCNTVNKAAGLKEHNKYTIQ